MVAALKLDTRAIPTTEDVMEIVRSEAEAILNRRSQSLRDFMASQWPNPSNSGPHASGRPSQSTGASSGAMRVDTDVSGSTFGMEWGFDDNPNPERNITVGDYYEYVHFTGAPTGNALNDASARFQRESEAIKNDIITAALARLGG